MDERDRLNGGRQGPGVRDDRAACGAEPEMVVDGLPVDELLARTGERA
jgi:hypothetical protein